MVTLYSDIPERSSVIVNLIYDLPARFAPALKDGTTFGIMVSNTTVKKPKEPIGASIHPLLYLPPIELKPPFSLTIAISALLVKESGILTLKETLPELCIGVL